ncbi:hypothetical protein CI109_100976 [Kwoniella shandongensis]|uniref:Uncharacterized protein n=1 Tax=Kwoniella shandongensis TaxID=1734106 RepID=A0A5M6C5J3_9TREE|nr:uncharacterized protein CI109_001444 [Kwoniella shandongensis]KAA5530041.1 hypothetical protein CI109_001444 [Kwoniella shandongensis]
MTTSLVVPIAYITVLVTGLAIFSRVYRKRRAAEKTSFEPWFPSHPTRELYISLISNPDSLEIPDSLLKSALLVRATTDVKRIWRIRDDKIALTNLHTRGLIGDDTMARFAAAEKELEAEIVDVVSEANTFRQGWGQVIFATATEMAQAEKTRDTVMSIPKIKAVEEKRIALRQKYLPTAPPSQPQIQPASSTTATPAVSPPSQTSSQVASPQKVSSGTSTPNLVSEAVGGGSGSGGSSKTGSPAPGSPAQSAASTPSKSTPSKKKGKKK